MPKAIVPSTSTKPKGKGFTNARKKSPSTSSKSPKELPKKAVSTKTKAKAKANNTNASATRKQPGQKRYQLRTRAAEDEKINGTIQRRGAKIVSNKAKSLSTLKSERLPRDKIPPQYKCALITLTKDTEGPGLELLNPTAINKLKATHKGENGLKLKNWPLDGRTVIITQGEYHFNIKMVYN